MEVVEQRPAGNVGTVRDRADADRSSSDEKELLGSPQDPFSVLGAQPNPPVARFACAGGFVAADRHDVVARLPGTVRRPGGSAR